MQVLDDADLSVIFEYMTQHHQVKNMESLLGAQQSERKEQPAAKQEEKPAEKAPEQTPASSKVKQVHRIDTRGTGDVNLAKYFARFTSPVPRVSMRCTCLTLEEAGVCSGAFSAGFSSCFAAGCSLRSDCCAPSRLSMFLT